MDRRGGCCIARYSGGGGGVYDVSKVNRILLRYRPIAPKPAVGGGSTCKDPLSKESTVKSGRGRRKAGVHRNNIISKNNNKVGSKSSTNRSCSRKRKVSENQSHPAAAAVVTLPLLPETPDRKDSPSSGSSSSDSPAFEVMGSAAAQRAPIWLNFGNNIAGNHMLGGDGGELVYMFQKQPVMERVVASWVKVESVSDTWVDEYGPLGCTDEERLMNLQEDTCPAFITDPANRVTWTNKSYRKLVAGGGCGSEEEEKEVVVWLVLRDGVELPTKSNNCAAFTCQVSVATCWKENGKSAASLTLPCDVWRLGSGGFAWRLDVKAALCLGSFKN